MKLVLRTEQAPEYNFRKHIVLEISTGATVDKNHMLHLVVVD